jgi:hypothetical protein
MEASGPREVHDGQTESSLVLEVYKAERAHELMLNQATSAFEHAAIAPLLVLNGGGAVAFLTLLGAVSNPSSRFSASTGWAVAAAIAWAVGLVLAALAASFGLGSQRAFSRRQRIERQAVERLLLRGSSIAPVVADPSRDAQDATSDETPRWKSEMAKERRDALRYRRLYEFSRWTSIAGFICGVGCAAASVA